MKFMKCCPFMLLLLHSGNALSNTSEKNVKQFKISPSGARYENSIEQTHITVNFTTNLHVCKLKFLSVAIDSNEVKNNWKGFDFRSAKLQTMAAALSPTDFRLGGTNADFLTFDPTARMEDVTSPSEEAQSIRYEFDSGHFEGNWKKDLTNFTMTANQWDTLTTFLQKVGWDLMFDFNLFKWKDGLWDPSNAALLLNYSAARNIKIPYFQLGNEPNSFLHNFNFTISPATILKDFQILKNLISSYKQYSNGLLYGPDVTNLDRHTRSREYFREFVDAGAYSLIDEYGLHHYYMDGRTATAEDFLNFSIMDSLKSMLGQGLNISRQSPNPRPLRLTETSSCYGGGAPGLSDGYVAGFLWLDKLGVAAQLGVTRVFRQTFFGAHYALISSTLDPNPDFYLSVLYKRLIEGPVFDVSLDPSVQYLRVYAHCARTDMYPPGALVLYYLNLRDQWSVLSLTQFGSDELDLYLLTPGDDKGLKSRFVKLNGVTLQMDGSKLPPMKPKQHKGDISVEPQSFGFVVVPHAQVPSCASYFKRMDRRRG